MSPRNHKLSPRIDGRLAAYATVAGAALAAPALPNADASIVYSGVVNYNIPVTSAGIYLNVVTGMTSINPASVPGWDLNPWGTTNLQIWGNNAANDGVLDNFTGGSAGSVDNLPVGAMINGTWNYGQTDSSIETAGPTAFNLNSSNNIFGFRFLNETTGMYDFGWARVSLSSTQTGPRAIVEYAYDNMGNAIAAGAIPEPSTLALLGVMAAGAIGVRAWRKQKNS